MNPSLKMHPLMVIAATAVILTCLLAIAIMTGIVPGPLTRDRAAAEEKSPPPQAAVSASRPTTARSPAAPVGTTRSDPPYGTVAGSAPTVAAPPAIAAPAPAVAPPPPVLCDNCGTVTSVRTVRRQGEASVVGPLAGGAIGGVVGNQIGSGSGRTLATIAGAAGGAVIGTEVERRSKTTTHYVVGVRLDDGTARRFTYQAAPGMREGDKVRIVDGKLVRDS